ncbi:hypothetical protein C7293_31510 [filamentous cyanobacterium CCT1]|nr:hypothetical protein C7293_31510 [filamentous cyanobacterium CCT1]
MGWLRGRLRVAVAQQHLDRFSLPVAGTGKVQPLLVVNAAKAQAIAYHRAAIKFQHVLAGFGGGNYRRRR